jgi:ribosomal protein S21
VIEVVVQSSFEEAIKELKKKIGRDGIFATLKLRSEYPNLTDRAKKKAILSLQRKRQSERRAAARLRYGRGRAPKRAEQGDYRMVQGAVGQDAI